MINKGTIYLLIQETRPRQWIKNLIVFSVLIFSNQLFDKHNFLLTIATFCVLTLLTSSIYIINDIVDKDEDKLHPDKKSRPIASGKLGSKTALIFSLFLITLGIILSYNLSEYILAIYVFYLIMMICYSFFLKSITILDSLTIAIGFVLRVIAGAIIINVPISSYFIILVICTALLISFGKRRGEITLLKNMKAIAHRKVLKEYPKQMLDNLISALLASTFFAYILYTFQQDLGNTNRFLVTYLPQHFKNPHWLKLTIPLVFYILARYTYLIYSKGGTLEKMLFEDKPLFISVILWIVSIGIIIYSPLSR